MDKLKVGDRVVRGPDWQDRDLDGGDGCLGTVVKVAKDEVFIKWDRGPNRNVLHAYGADGLYDVQKAGDA